MGIRESKINKLDFISLSCYSVTFLSLLGGALYELPWPFPTQLTKKAPIMSL